jgi:CO dehydrogenase maturation factor
MRVAFVGKGGSGKTTLSSLFSRFLASKDLSVLAIDADINQNLAIALGVDESETVPPMGLEMNRIKDYLKGSNPLISSVHSMIKTTPPGMGSLLITLNDQNPIYEHFQKEIDGVRFMVTGPFDEEDLGIRCYHSKTGAVEMFLNHLIDKQGEYVVVDMTAGADSFASGMFTRFDVTLLAVEPTIRGIAVYKQYKEYSKDFNVKLRVIGNKIKDQVDIEFLKTHTGDDLLTYLFESDYIRSLEKGYSKPFSELEPENLDALEKIQEEIDKQKKDWDKYHRQTIEFHIKNAKSWANDSTGEDLTLQIDPNFNLRKEVEKYVITS